MKDVCEAIMYLAACSVPVSIMGFAAFLLYKKADGWGWYLLVAALLCSAMRFKVGN